MMKIISIVTSKFSKLMLMVFTLLSPILGFSQPASGNGGIAPAGDGSAVPFDDHMNLLFLVAGLVFAGVVISRQMMGKKG